VYLAVNAAFLWAVPIPEMARSKLVAADAAEHVIGARGDALIALLAIVSVLGTLNESLLVNPRIAFATARAGLMPRAFTRVNEGGTPTAATAWNAALAFGIALSGTFDQLLAVVAFALTLGDAATTGSIFLFRRRDPAPPPFGVPAYPLVPLVFLLVNLGLLVGLLLLQPAEAGVGAGVAALAAVGYAVWTRGFRTRT
jgi:APA family basic amino acid/polyamine antiporter